MRDIQQRRLFSRPGFDLLLEPLLCLEARADVPDGAQDARPAKQSERRPAPLGVKRRAVPTDVLDQRLEHGAGSQLLGEVGESVLAIGMDEGWREKPNECLTGVAVHRARRGVRLDHGSSVQIGEDQSVGGSIEDAAIPLTVLTWREMLQARLHGGAFLQRPVAWCDSISARPCSGLVSNAGACPCPVVPHCPASLISSQQALTAVNDESQAGTVETQR